MAKKDKGAAASAKKKEAKPVDPIATKNLIRLLNILALLLAIAAFLLQLFAVLSHHWKWQTTNLHQIMSPTYHYAGPNVYEDSILDQHYGLCSRNVRVYANNDEQLDVWASTRFPRIDDDDNEKNFHQCLSQTSSLRGIFLTCSNRVVSPPLCHCRRYFYWNFVIAFEIAALILLGIVVFLTALLTTQYQVMLKLAAAGLAILAFILLLVGLILILTHLKRETRSFADSYPHIHQTIADKLNIVHNQYRGQQQYPTVLHRAVRRRAINRRDTLYKEPDHYRAYPLTPGQHPYNETHFQEYSEEAQAWLYLPYTSIVAPAAYSSYPQQVQGAYAVDARQNTTAAPAYNPYGPVLGYDGVYSNTRAGIGWSTILSIIALALALLSALILLFSWLKSKSLVSDGKTTTKTVQAEYVLVPQQDVTVETTHTRPIYTDYSSARPIGDAFVTTHNVPVQSIHNVPAQPASSKLIPVTYSSDRPIGEALVTTHNVPIQSIHNVPGQPIYNAPGQPLYNTPGQSIYNTPGQTVSAKQVPLTYSPNQPMGDAVVTTHPVYQGPYGSQSGAPETFIVRDVIIRDEPPVTQITRK